VSRAAIIVALLLGSCDPIGDTCGRGRCPTDRCITIFADTPLKRSNQGWQDQRYPQVDGEWWCVRDHATCPASLGCADKCLEDPADENVVVCAGTDVKIVFYSRGRSVLEGLANQVVTSYQLVNNPDAGSCRPDTANVLKTCSPKMDCELGTLNAGDPIPATLLTSAQNKTLLYCPADPDNKLGPLLPKGKTVRIYADQD
jgi:hypothetical protein